MTERRRYKPYGWEPLRMTPAEVAEAVFRRSESWLMSHPQPGFPEPVDGLYATEAVREWVRQRHGIAPVADDEQAVERRIVGRLGNGAGARALSSRKAA